MGRLCKSVYPWEGISEIQSIKETAWAGNVYSSKAWKMQAVLGSSQCKQPVQAASASSQCKQPVQAVVCRQECKQCPKAASTSSNSRAVMMVWVIMRILVVLPNRHGCVFHVLMTGMPSACMTGLLI